MLDASVKPSMVSAGTQRDEIVLMLNVLDLLWDQSLIFFDVSADATVLGRGRAIRTRQMLTRSKKGSWSSVSANNPCGS